MLPIILVSQNSTAANHFLESFIKKHAIAYCDVLKISPEKKEITIAQVRLLKKDLRLLFTSPRLFVLYEFQNTSSEAQNALLKTLEEHPENVFFILVVDRLAPIISTITSRAKVVIAGEAKEISVRQSVHAGLAKLQHGDDLGILGDKTFDAKSYANPLEVLDELLSYYQNRLPADAQATQILREIITVRWGVEQNNVNAQTAVDHLLIFINRAYLTAREKVV